MAYTKLEQAYVDTYLETMYPTNPEQPGTLLAAGPKRERTGQVTVTGYTEPPVVTDVMPEIPGFINQPEQPPQAEQPEQPAQPSQVRVGRGGLTLEQSAKAGGLDKPLMALADMLAGATRGATSQTIGLAGDVESIFTGLKNAFINPDNKSRVNAFLEGMAQPTTLPTTEQVSMEGFRLPGTNINVPALAPVVPPNAPNQADRQGIAQFGQGAGEFLPLPGVVDAAKLAVKAIKSTKGMPVGLSMKIVGDAPVSAPVVAQPVALTKIDPKSLPVVQKIVADGIASSMSATKMIQAVEKQTGTKLTGIQQKELKQYVSENVPKGQVYSDQAFKDLIAQPFPFEPSTQRFTKSFDDAMNWIKTLDQEDIKNAAVLANQRLAPILGTGADGKVKRLLTTNGKLLKTETGIEGGVPIELPDGRNIESAGLAISPAFKAEKFSTCPNSASCAQECLGKTSGGYFAYGGGADLDAMKGTRLRSFRMTQAMFREPEAFAIKLNEEIFSLKKIAEKNGNALAIRLNVLSDIDPKVHKSIIEANPDVLFYDYTKMKYRPVAPNHHYTYSSTGLSQKAGQNGLTVDVDNPHANWTQMRQWLDDGQNVAMAFSSKKGLPESVLDEATGKTYQVIDGDAYDFRPMDAQPKGSNGVIVGLKNKAMTRKESMAAQDSNGFFVQYDPKLGTQVSIPRQRREVIMLKTDGKTTQPTIETGEQITEKAKR
jgi:hypothetical protein